MIIGGNAFYDSRETSSSNRYDQLGAGLEVLIEWIDPRVNAYWPNDDKNVINSYEDQEQNVTVEQFSSTKASGDPYFIEHRVEQRTKTYITTRTTTITTTHQFDIFEEALDGWDCEVGFKVPWIDK